MGSLATAAAAALWLVGFVCSTAPPTPRASELGWSTTILGDAAGAHGALCLDGSAPGYHIQHRNPERWTIHLQGGAWCLSPWDCLERSKGALGSSTSFVADMDDTLASFDGGAHGVFSSDAAVNPDFHNHTKAYLRYCDGASFAGDVAVPIVRNSTKLYFRGRRVLDAVLDSLIAAGLGNAKLLIVNGCSTGGLAVYLHLDHIQARLPGVRVVGVPECGLFMDEVHWDGTPGYTPSFKTVAQMQNVSGGVNADCIAAEAAKSGGGEAWKCFMAQYTLPHIKTPHYIVNSFYDAWQWGAVLGMPWKTCGQPPSHSSPARPGCERKLPPACPAPAREALERMRSDMISNQSRGSNAQSSAFLYACNTHCGQFSHDDRWGTLSIQGESLRAGFTRWLSALPRGDHTDSATMISSGGVAQMAAVDCAGLGCNPTCCDADDDDDGH